ncbi:MAG: hypothetical protein IJP28_04020 [Erysipelotrichales bacterium]|nr:hypothetical protein [Erysipelotrichales bacterium]
MRKTNKIITIFLLITIFSFFGLVVSKIAVKNIVYDILHIDNEIVAFFLQDDSEYKNIEDPIVYVNHQANYPFKETQTKTSQSTFDKILSKVSKLQTVFEDYTSENLLFRLDFMKGGYAFEDLLNLDIISMQDDSAVIELREGYLTALNGDKDMTVAASNLVAFKDYVETQGAEFLYIQVPYKISEEEEVSALYRDYSNENSDTLLSLLQQSNVDTLDLREEFSNRYQDLLPLFYKTDHHWKIETGLEAASITAEYLAETYGYNMHTENLVEEAYTTEVYEDSFLGSRGRKVTLAKTELEDFTLLLPNFESNVCAYIPDRSIDTCGSFYDTLIDPSKLGSDDYYNVSPYHTYAYGDRPVIEIENQLVTNNKKILILRDSFSVPLVPFLSLSTQSIHSLDLRYFTGSVETYIEQYQPYLVIVAYNPSVFVDSKNIEYQTHTNMFDFK